MPLIATRGAASAQGFGEFAQTAAPVYIEDVFSTYLYVGNGSTQTITNGIDLSTKGGLVWLKSRSTADDNSLFDTLRGTSSLLRSNLTNAALTGTAYLSSYNSNGFGLNAGSALTNASGERYVSWTFREQPKFFDVVTYTGTGSPRTVSHNLGSAPGCIIVKRYDSTGSWAVWHRSGTQTNGKFAAFLNTSGAYEDQAENLWGSETVAPDMNASTFGVGTAGSVNSNGFTYVAYLFAHNAGGFGTSGSDNVISCGSYTGNGSTSGPTVTLGYEPQWLMIKAASTTGSWQMIDNMRGMVVGGNEARLLANSTSAELSNDYLSPTATGFQLVSTSSEVNGNGQTYIYIAIRRGPMKTPTTGTSIFTPTAFAGNDTSGTRSAGLDAFDLLISKRTASSALDWVWLDKLRALTGTTWLASNSTSAETASGGTLDTINTINGQYTQNGINITKTTNYSYLDAGGSNYVWYALKRAPGFFDEVCYTGTGANLTVAHNLTVVPELIIAKNRTTSGNNWPATFNFTSTNSSYAFVNLTSAGGNDTYANVGVMTAQPTSTNLFLSPSGSMNTSGNGHVAYLFATVAGVSKVGTYTGTGALQTVNCGFTGGARFVLIKRTDSTGDWFVYDSAQGISSGNDPYLRMNLDAVQVTGTNYVDTTSVGFQVTAAAPVGLNANGGTYIFLAIA